MILGLGRPDLSISKQAARPSATGSRSLCVSTSHGHFVCKLCDTRFGDEGGKRRRHHLGRVGIQYSMTAVCAARADNLSSLFLSKDSASVSLTGYSYRFPTVCGQHRHDAAAAQRTTHPFSRASSAQSQFARRGAMSAREASYFGELSYTEDPCRARTHGDQVYIEWHIYDNCSLEATARL